VCACLCPDGCDEPRTAVSGKTAYLAAQGLDPATSTPDELAQIVRDEIPKFAKIAKVAGIKPE
jgi:hypothetical protein